MAESECIEVSVGVYVGASGCKAKVKVKVQAAETKEDKTRA